MLNVYLAFFKKYTLIVCRCFVVVDSSTTYLRIYICSSIQFKLIQESTNSARLTHGLFSQNVGSSLTTLK